MQTLIRHPYPWIAAIALAIHARTLAFGFVYFDDNLVILDQLAFLGDPANLLRVFAEDVFRSGQQAYYRPLLALSLMVDTQLGGGSPFGYHLTNIGLHAAASCAVFAVLEKLGYERPPSLAAALLFALMPVHTQAVAWIMGRNDLLLACFALLSFRAYLTFLDGERRSPLAWHWGLLLAALLTKESAIALPVVCIAYLGLSPNRPGRGRLLAQLLPGWLGCTAMWWVARSAAFQQPRPIDAESIVRSMGESLAATTQLVGKLALPFDLSVLPIVEDTSFLPGIAVVALLLWVVATAPAERRWRACFGLTWMAAFMLPTFVRPATSGPAHHLEHRMVLPALGFLVVMLESPLLRGYRLEDRRRTSALAAVLVLFAGVTLVHQENFRDRMAFWQSAARSSPHHPLAQRNLGAMYYLDGSLEKAERHYHDALRLNPDEVAVRNNLGLIHAQRGEWEQAEAAYRDEIERNPAYADAYFNLAVLYMERRDASSAGPDPAIELLYRTLDLAPHHPRAGLLLERIQTSRETPR